MVSKIETEWQSVGFCIDTGAEATVTSEYTVLNIP